MLLNFRTLLACLILATGLLSYVLFLCRRYSDMTPKKEKKKHSKTQTSLWEKALDDCKNWRQKQKWHLVSFSVSLSAFVWILIDFFSKTINAEVLHSDGHTIWAAVMMSTMFIPGLQWHSMDSLNNGSNRLIWFLSSLFFPLTITASRVRINLNTISFINCK